MELTWNYISMEYREVKDARARLAELIAQGYELSYE